MRNIITVIASVAALGTFTAPVSAQHYDHSSIKDAPAAHNWTGFYVGAHIGYGHGTTDSFLANVAKDDVRGTTFDPDGVIAGGQAGFNFQAGRLVFGVEGDIAASGIEGSGTYPAFFAPTDVTSELSWLATLRGRVGVTVGNFLVYGTGGVAFGEVESTYVTARADIAASHSETRTGYAVGGGLEYALSKNTSLKIEYLYVDLGDEEYEAFNNVTGAHVGYFGSDLTLETAKVGVNYRF